MEKIKNKMLGCILILLSILCVLANYYDILRIPAIILGLLAAIAIAVVVCKRVYEYRSRFMGSDHKIWWLTFTSIAAFILVIVFYGLGFDLITVKLAKSLLIGLAPMLIPILGVGIGLIIRFIKY